MICLIGIDIPNENTKIDQKAKELGEFLHQESCGKLLSVSIHQLYKKSEGMFASYHPVACIQLDCISYEKTIEKTVHFYQDLLNSGSEFGFCIAQKSRLNNELIDWSKKSKSYLPNSEEADVLAKNNQIYLSGNHITGAMAAIGLFASGKDGHFEWLVGLKNLRSGIYTVGELPLILDVDGVAGVKGEQIESTDKVFLSDWVRPVLINHKRLILVEEVPNYSLYQWESVSKNFVRSFTK